MTSTVDPRKRRRPALATPVLLCAALAATPGCGQMESELWGTVSPSYSLEFDEVRAYSIGNELFVVYEKRYDPPSLSSTMGHPIRNQVARLSFSTDAPELVEEQDVQLTAQGKDPPVGRVTRHVVAADSMGTLAQEEDFPDLHQGTVYFEALGDALGEPVEGSFECAFKNTLTLRGRFHAVLTQP